MSALVSDSLAEAYKFYNLYSWEVAFGIRYGHSYIVMKHITTAKKELREDDTPVAPLYYSSGAEDDWEARQSTNRTAQLEGLAESGAMTSDGVLIKEPLIKRGRGGRFKSFLNGGCKKTATKDKRQEGDRPEGLSKQTTFCKRCRKPGHNSSTCMYKRGTISKKSRQLAVGSQLAF